MLHKRLEKNHLCGNGLIMLQSLTILPTGTARNQIMLKEMNIAGYLHKLPVCMTKFVPKCTKACVSDRRMDDQRWAFIKIIYRQ